jgi:hypothetical protein
MTANNNPAKKTTKKTRKIVKHMPVDPINEAFSALQQIAEGGRRLAAIVMPFLEDGKPKKK